MSKINRENIVPGRSTVKMTKRDGSTSREIVTRITPSAIVTQHGQRWNDDGDPLNEGAGVSISREGYYPN